MLRSSSISFMKPFDNPSLHRSPPFIYYSRTKYLLNAHAIPMLTWESHSKQGRLVPSLHGAERLGVIFTFTDNNKNHTIINSFSPLYSPYLFIRVILFYFCNQQNPVLEHRSKHGFLGRVLRYLTELKRELKAWLPGGGKTFQRSQQ